MTTLVEQLLPDELWRLVEPLLPPLRAPGGAAGVVPSPTATASPRSSTWPAPPLRGGCYQRASLAVARQRLDGGGWTSGPRLACSTGSTSTSWTGSAGSPGLDARECGLGQHARQTRGDHVGANPVDRGKPGSKLHLVCDGGGLPLTAAVTAANVPDVTMLAAMVDDIQPVRTPTGRRRTRPGKLDADKATTALPTAATCAGGGSGRGSPGVGSSRRRGLGGIAGRLSGRCRGCRATGGWPSAGIGGRSGSLRSCCWRVRWCASTGADQLAASRRGNASHQVWSLRKVLAKPETGVLLS
jgi:Transposase DDE domain